MSPQPTPSHHAAGAGMAGLRAAHQLLWDRLRHLFPPHAQAPVTWSGAVSIAWRVADGPGPGRQSAPVLLQVEPDWLLRLLEAPSDGRAPLLDGAEALVRHGLQGYDPEPAVPRARVIVIG